MPSMKKIISTINLFVLAWTQRDFRNEHSTHRMCWELV